MGGWHECDERCHQAHASLSTKLLGLLYTSRRCDPVSLPLNINCNILSPYVDLKSDPWRSLWEVRVVLHVDADLGGRLLLHNPPQGASRNREVLEIPTQSYANGRGIELERWRIQFDPDETLMGPLISLGEFKRHLAMAMRSIYCLSRILPAFRLRQSITRPVSVQGNSLPPPLTLHIEDNDQRIAVTLEQSILSERSFEPSSLIELATLPSPHGHVTVSVRYRKNCRFDYDYGQSSTRCSFENVTLEVPPLQTINIGGSSSSNASVFGRTPTNVVSTPNEFRFGTSLSSRSLHRPLPVHSTERLAYQFSDVSLGEDFTEENRPQHRHRQRDRFRSADNIASDYYCQQEKTRINLNSMVMDEKLPPLHHPRRRSYDQGHTKGSLRLEAELFQLEEMLQEEEEEEETTVSPSDDIDFDKDHNSSSQNISLSPRRTSHPTLQTSKESHKSSSKTRRHSAPHKPHHSADHQKLLALLLELENDAFSPNFRPVGLRSWTEIKDDFRELFPKVKEILSRESNFDPSLCTDEGEGGLFKDNANDHDAIVSEDEDYNLDLDE